MVWDDEILRYAEGVGLSDSEFAALSNEITAARGLPPGEMRTAIRIALAKYPQTREMVRRFANDPMTGTLRGDWLSREDWTEFNTGQTEAQIEADDLASRFLNMQIPASDLNETAQVAVVKELLARGDSHNSIRRLLDLSRPAYERIRRRAEQNG